MTSSCRSSVRMAAGVLGWRPVTMLISAMRSYRSALVLLATVFFIGDMLDGRWAFLVIWPLTYLLFAVIVAASRGPKFLHYANAAVAFISYPLAMATTATGSEALTTPGSEIFVLYALTALGLILRDVLRRETVTIDVILGASAAYILLGATFALIYNVAVNIDSNAFVPAQEPGDSMYYFSFVTLTTVGYGDITPAANWLRSIAVIEGLTGQISLVVLVARLVGLEVAQRTR